MSTAVEHRVIGPPGCGKTHYISRQAKRAAEEFGGSAVLVTSFTKAAAKEAAGRIEGIPPENVSTLHAQAYRRLEHPVIAEKGAPVKAWNEWVALPAYKLSDTSQSMESSILEGGSYDTRGDELLQEIGTLRARMIDPKMWPQECQAFWGYWTEFKQANGYLDFSDLIEQAVERVDLEGISVMMLDEAQDMSRLEFGLARKWAEQVDHIVVVGDPDQNLYEWRGADPKEFYSHEAASEHVLEQSYRVPAAVHRKAVEWIEQTPGRVPVAYHPTDVEGTVVAHQEVCYQDGLTLAALVRDAAKRGTVMVLASCAYMLTPLTRTLRDQGIPFHNPYRPDHGAWNPLLGATRVLAFTRPDRKVWGDEARLWTWDDVWRWLEVLVAKDLLKRGAKTFVKAKATATGRFDDSPEATVDLEVLGRLFEDVGDLVAASSMSIDWFRNNLMATHVKAQSFSVRVAQLHGARLLREVPRVIVGTVHSVKGGEADTVIVCPDLSRVAYWDHWMAQDTSPVYRLFYVAMTRARHELHLLGGGGIEAVKW